MGDEQVGAVVNSPAGSGPLRVLCLYSDILGHVTFIRWLREALSTRPQDVAVTYAPLSQYIKSDLVGRAIRKVTTPAVLPGRRTRNEIAASYLALRVINRHIRIGAFDLVHLHTQALGLVLPEVTQVPVVVSLDITASLLGKTTRLFDAVDTKALPWLERREFRHVAQVGAWSEWASHSVVNDYGMSKSRARCIPPPIAEAGCADGSGNANPPAGVVVFIGNDFNRKGGAELLAAFSRLPQRVRATTVVHIISGDPEAVRQAEGQWHVVVHAGLTPRDDRFRALMATATVLVFPTKEEAYGLVLLEAMSWGIPVITTNIMAIPEITGHGAAGILVPPGEIEPLVQAMETVLTDPGMGAEMGRRGREIIRSCHRPARVADLWVETYKMAIGR